MSVIARCPSCGASYTPDARFCPKDGTKLVADQFHEPAVPPASHAAPRVVHRVVPRPPAAPAAPPLRRGTPPVANQASLAGTTLDGRYHVSKKIGEGGMSFVYLADDATTGERVAIKILAPKLATDPTAMARLRREAELGGRLAHPNVCHIIRLGETADGRVYIVMPFLQGELLCDRESRVGHIPLAEALPLIGHIAAGLGVAHALGIIHRDLKPENVMLCPAPDGSERAVVMDFGLAKERVLGGDLQKLTATGIVLGTPEFMSPEQLRGKPLDARTDIYALALLAFEMLTGKLPFAGKTQQDVMIARLKGDPIPIRDMRPELKFPAAVERVLMRGMQREPMQRYATAAELATALTDAAQSDSNGMLDRLFGR